MDWINILFSIIIAIIVTGVFAIGFKNKGPWGAISSFFLIIFLAVWAASLWLTPGGSLSWGYALIPVAIVGVVFALIISASSPPGNRKTIRFTRKAEAGLREKEGPETNPYGLYFWLVAVALVIIIAFGYFY